MSKSENGNDAFSSDEEEVISISGSRVGPPELPAIVFEGKRYAQVSEGHLEGLDQRTGLLAVFNDETNERLATVTVYTVEYIEMLETDVQDVFFSQMTLDAAARMILIENERGKRYSVSLDDLSVKEVD